MDAIANINVELVRWRLDLAEQRAALAGANIANVHTDGYMAQRLGFADQVAMLRQAVENHDVRDALRTVRSEGFMPEASPPQNLLGGSVDIDNEIVELVNAGTRYRALTTMLNRHFGLMRLAVSSRG